MTTQDHNKPVAWMKLDFENPFISRERPTVLWPDAVPVYLHPAPIPDDMVMVPREPTEAMLFALAEDSASNYPREKKPIVYAIHMHSPYKAMIAAYEKEQDNG